MTERNATAGETLCVRKRHGCSERRAYDGGCAWSGVHVGHSHARRGVSYVAVVTIHWLGRMSVMRIRTEGSAGCTACLHVPRMPPPPPHARAFRTCMQGHRRQRVLPGKKTSMHQCLGMRDGAGTPLHGHAARRERPVDAA